MASVVLEQLNVSFVFSILVALGIILFLKRISEFMAETIRINRALSVFPSLPWHWLYGSLKPAKKSFDPEFIAALLEGVKEHPRAYICWRGPYKASLVVVHPDTIRPILKKADPKCNMYDISLKPWLGEGLLIAHGERWAQKRRLLTQAFHFDTLRSYVYIFNDASDVFMNIIEEHIKKDKARDLFERVSLLTLDIILQCAFSHTTDCQLQRKRHPYVDAVDKITHVWSKRYRNMASFIYPPLYWVSSEGRQFKALCDILHKEAETIINARKQQLVLTYIKEENGPDFSKNKKSLDFLDILLTSKDEDGKGMPREDIIAEVDTFLFEGHDTTTSGISWTLYLLASHPKYQKEAQEEMDTLVSEQGSDRLDRSCLSRLPVLTRCLKESMRLYPPIPLISRQLSQDLVVDGHHVPAGTTVNIPVWSVHHNNTVWGDDHMEYKPSRFEEENICKMDPFAYIPFSAGPRNCIGQTFALWEEKIVLARLLHRYNFSVAEDSPMVRLDMRVTLRPEKDIKLKVTRR